jgi:hypothetical protein
MWLHRSAEVMNGAVKIGHGVSPGSGPVRQKAVDMFLGVNGLQASSFQFPVHG